MGINSKDKRDVYYYQAKVMGYRARSAFKLLDINETFSIFSDCKNIVDLCAAPGSWSQVLSKIENAKILAVDVQDMIPIDRVKILKEDITSLSCLESIMEFFCGKNVDLVVCDGAPDVTGLHDLDEYLQADLLKSALSITVNIAKPGATFVGKCFRGRFTGYLVRHFAQFFDKVEVVKPRSSRGATMECFFLCRNLKESSKDPLMMDCTGEPVVFEVKECGFGPDPDYTFTEAAESIAPKANPQNPPYKDAIDARRAQ